MPERVKSHPLSFSLIICRIILPPLHRALIWYLLSYIPYGQAAAKRITRRLLKRAGIEVPSLLAVEASHSAGVIGPAAEGPAA